MLAPKRQKYRKQFRGVWRRMATKGEKITFGMYALKSLSAGWIKDKEIEAARVSLARATRKNGKFWIRIFPDKPYTKKPPEVRMGGGKAPIDHYAAVVRPGTIIFEVSGLSRVTAVEAFRIAASKFSFKTALVEGH